MSDGANAKACAQHEYSTNICLEVRAQSSVSGGKTNPVDGSEVCERCWGRHRDVDGSEHRGVNARSVKPLQYVFPSTTWCCWGIF